MADTGNRDTILSFGKYRGSQIQEVFETDPSYCRWLKTQMILIGDDPSIRSFLDEKFKNTDQSFVMTFGKHKNKTVQWIKDNDRGYFDWLCANEFVNTKCKRLRAALSELEQK